MKKFLILVLLGCAVSANGQKLLDALYSGKLKMDSGSVIRKSDDWTSKIDTSTKKPVAPEIAKAAPVNRDPSLTNSNNQSDPAAVPVTPVDNEAAVAVKDNNKVWKDYMDEFIGTLKTEVMTSKKIKNGTYSVLIEYEIGVDGQITVNNVSSSPESSFLDQQVKERLMLSAPQMTPLLSNYGKPRKAVKKQTITLSK